MSRRRGSGSIFKQPGCKTWTIKFSSRGKTVREATGERDYSAAMQKLTQRLREVDTSSFIEPEVRRIQVNELAEDFLRDYRINGRKSLEHAERRWKLHLEPFFGALRVADVSSTLIGRYVDERLNAGAKNATVNREMAALKKMFRLGYYASPAKVPRLPKFPRLQEDPPRSGFLEDEQYDRLTLATSELWLRTLLEVAHVYGWRKQELLNLRARHCDLIARTIRLDPGSTKNREGREASMTDTVHALLSECLRGKTGDDCVFTRPNGRPIRKLGKAWDDARVAAGLARMLCRKCETQLAGEKCDRCGASGRDLKCEGLILHDTRRTAARNFRRAGVAEGVIMRIGGWKTRSVFDRYAIVSQSDVVDALQKLEKRQDEQAREMKKSAQQALECGHDAVMTRPSDGFSAAAAKAGRVN
ncbi:MAG TPA: tyrosine-type recombinase/integrase [Acidobacteriota bacterium]|nr:tyrosine-type recombinase/integrase [Acidobacteriota bacterium]